MNRGSRQCRFCCKSLKTPGDKFPARRRNKPRSLIDVASGSLPRSPVSLSLGDEVPHMFTRKPHLRLEKFAITCTKKTFATKSANCGLMHCNKRRASVATRGHVTARGGHISRARCRRCLRCNTLVRVPFERKALFGYSRGTRSFPS
jgi:hypothetical protein